MIRKKLRAAAKKAALRAFKMEEQAKARETNSTKVEDSPYRADLIPQVVQGSGDTPGPNHKTLIGRTWVSAQLAGGVAPLLVDIRPPEQWPAGHIPGALMLPGDQIVDAPSPLGTDSKVRVTLYDATGGATPWTRFWCPCGSSTTSRRAARWWARTARRWETKSSRPRRRTIP